MDTHAPEDEKQLPSGDVDLIAFEMEQGCRGGVGSVGAARLR